MRFNKKPKTSKIAKQFNDALAEAHLNPSLEHPIINPWVGQQYIDTALPDFYMAFEVYTDYWRKTKTGLWKKARLEKDRAKEGYLRSLGWDVWWIPTRVIDSPKKMEETVNHILFYLNNCKRFTPEGLI